MARIAKGSRFGPFIVPIREIVMTGLFSGNYQLIYIDSPMVLSVV
jgi:hypothetical protein